MTTGSSSWNGLGMGLSGEYELTQIVAATDFLTLTGASSMGGDFLVLRDSDNSEKLYINNVGTIYIRNDVDATAYLGIDARGTINDAATGTWFSGCGFRITNNAAVGGQVYAGNFHWIGGTSANHTGGRGAVINLICDIQTGYGGTAWNTMAFINMSDQNTNVPSLFSFPDSSADDGGFFQASDGDVAVTHLISINVGNTQYWICVSDSSAT